MGIGHGVHVGLGRGFDHGVQPWDLTMGLGHSIWPWVLAIDLGRKS